MAWQYIGTVSVSPETDEATVGSIEVPTVGGVQIKLVQETSAPFQFGYGLLSYRSSYGNELGTIRVWPRRQFTSYLLGQGMTVVDNYGALIFEPRTWSQRWVKAGFPLTITFLADLATDLPADRALADGFTDEEGEDLILSPSGSLGRLTF